MIKRHLEVDLNTSEEENKAQIGPMHRSDANFKNRQGS
jgi:hypothetical protein